VSLFITFEGVEGCGKTTQLEMLKETLRKEGFAITATREPGGTEIGEKIRSILLKEEGNKLSLVTELLLYIACRAQLVEEVIRPALNRGEIVLCDRFMDSTVVYQGSGRGIDKKVIKNLNELAADDVTPDLTFILDCTVEYGLNKAMERMRITEGEASKENRFEMAEIAFHRKIREGFLTLGNTNKRFNVINGERDKVKIHKEIYNIVKTYLTKMSAVKC
jgi:dTMP kinase